MGLYRMISDIGFIVGPLLLGYVSDIDVTFSGEIGVLPFLVASLILVSAGLALLKADDPAKRRRAQLERRKAGPAPDR
jgi:MFS-type transporter involved in bile tolerance (Atg22 family)